VRSLRQARGWTQEALAEKASVHENYVSRLETGRQEPGLLVILKLAAAFTIKPSELLDKKR
jgi:transcriptional regulator with XRE-family HTH domain